jgi:hypothetical protein
MNPTKETTELNQALADMRDKSRVLNDSLKTLAADGFDRLTGVAARANAPSRKPESQILTAELGKLMRQEVMSGIQNLFGRSMPQNNGPAGMNVIINNNAGVNVSAREGMDGLDRKYLEITIDQMVANSLMRGRQTSGVMRTLFGLAPSLMGR